MLRLQYTQTLSQKLKLAPQLIHSLRLLQMPTLDLEQLIQQELEINPLLVCATGQGAYAADVLLSIRKLTEC